MRCSKQRPYSDPFAEAGLHRIAGEQRCEGRGRGFESLLKQSKTLTVRRWPMHEPPGL
jgi:hypothetical protein